MTDPTPDTSADGTGSQTDGPVAPWTDGPVAPWTDGPVAPWTDDGRPRLDSGEPVLARWFAILMVVLVPVGLVVIVWAFLSIGTDPIPVAERRPPGTTEVTHDRGTAVLNEDRTEQPGPDCFDGAVVIGDAGARSAAFRAFGAACNLLNRPEFGLAAQGLAQFLANDGALRFGVFQRSGVDASMRREDGRLVIELNAKFQFRDGTEAAPFVVHELAHLAQAFPGEPVSAEAEREAMFLQLQACEALVYAQEPPRGCFDARELIELEDTTGALVDAGYRRSGSSGDTG